MTSALICEACRFTLVLVLGAAAVGKARAIDRFAETLEALLSLRRWRRSAAVAIIAAESGVALALLGGGAAARYGALAALALLSGFTAVLLVALVTRRKVSCNCFGAGEHPISGWDVVRNLLLIAAAATQLLLGAPSEALTMREWLLALVAAGVAALMTTQLHRLRRAPSPVVATLGVSIGQAAPPFEGRARRSEQRVTSTELSGQAAVLLFLSSGCPKCHRALPQLLEMLPAIRSAGVALWILPADPTHDLATLLQGSALLEHALLVEPAVGERLNPRRVAPAYLFFDHHTVAMASGLIGDDDWQSFADQLREPAPSG